VIKINPLTIEKINRFKTIKRGYYSLWFICALILLSLFAELFVNNRALVVHYNGVYYFPVYNEMIPGREFGLDYEYETVYRDLKNKFEQDGGDNFVIMPPIPYSPFETNFKEGSFPPFPPSFREQHYLGTDKSGRDVLARLVYGFRIAVFFSLILMIANYAIGITLGCFMGYLGGRFDLFFQRIIEIWNNIPYLYAIIIISSIVIPDFLSLLGIMVFFGWIGMTWYMRTATYRERERDYVMAARAAGASTVRIIFSHILPNTVSVIITFAPFAIAAGITALTALDYLGFGMPPPAPSWGQLLSEASEYNINAPWIGISVISSLIIVLTMVTFIGEAVRESFDPRRFITYE